MKRFLLAIALLLPCCPLLAKAKHAPLPDTVTEAKTIYLVNHTGKQATLDSAYTEFQKWNRFAVVQDENADLRIVFSRSKSGEGGGATTMEVFVRGETDAAFETTEEFVTPDGLLQQVLIRDRSAKECVDDFWKRLK